MENLNVQLMDGVLNSHLMFTEMDNKNDIFYIRVE